MASRYPFVGAAAHLFPKNAIKMLSFSTSGKGSILLYPFRSSLLLAITFLYHPKDFFLYRAAALFEYPLIKRNQRATVINFKNHADSLFLSQICFLHLLHSLHLLLFVSQLFQFFAHGQLLLSDNGQNKSDQLFTVDRLWLGHYSLRKRTSSTLQIAFLMLDARIDDAFS